MRLRTVVVVCIAISHLGCTQATKEAGPTKKDTATPNREVASVALDSTKKDIATPNQEVASVALDPTKLGNDFMEAWKTGDAIRLRSLMTDDYQHEERELPSGDPAVWHLRQFKQYEKYEYKLVFSGTVKQSMEFHFADRPDAAKMQQEALDVWGVQDSDLVSEFSPDFFLFWRKQEDGSWRVFRSAI